jgi:ABC-type multidrug transport system fused ATPase/permease subunit
MQNFKKLIFLLTPCERKRGAWLLVMIIITALLDMIGIASILPFITVLSNPNFMETNIILRAMFQFLHIFGVKNNNQFFFVLGLFVFVLLIISIIFRAFTNYMQVRFVQMQELSIGKRLVEGYLNQPYSWFLSRHSADLGKTILSEVGQVIQYGLRPLTELISKVVVTIMLITLLVIADPKLALIVSILLASFYGVIFYFIRRYLNRIGNENLKNNKLLFIAVSEAFGAIKEIKVAGLEKIYVKLFSNSLHTYARNQASAQIISQLPRFILEAIAFGGILLIMLFIIVNTGSFNNALPIVSLYIFVGYRSMPAIQQIYSSLAQLTFVTSSLNKLHYDLKNLKSSNENQDQAILSINKKINLKNISYSYPNSLRTTLNNISLSIPVKSTVGLIGATGSGKTTMVDIIMGLLEPQKGTLEVDGIIITKNNLRTWQRSIGYVPQNIYLSDDTVSANIAFGVDSKYINQKAVEKAASIANLHKFILDELPKQYQTTIGERGVRLSGGQRQRIGIARALYHNPQILIFDEATSALDNETEQAVVESINNLNKNMTIIIIAHRLNTVKNCQIIFKLDKGQLIDQGTFNDVIKN